MSIYAFICTRTRDLSNVTNNLVSYLSSAGAQVKLLVNQDSIFDGYKKAFEKVSPVPSDIIILCHDDIEIDMPLTSFLKVMSILQNHKYGFVGPAGTTHLSENAVWWDQTVWKEGKHRGAVHHINPEGKKYFTHYGAFDQVLVLDGLFLAARAEVLQNIGLDKPPYFEGKWDFYDIYYTYEAHKHGYENHAIPITLTHLSRGELAGRDSWHKNRLAFINENRKDFPLVC
jgi:hypothetical protein